MRFWCIGAIVCFVGDLAQLIGDARFEHCQGA
jgi:hypothetical protein